MTSNRDVVCWANRQPTDLMISILTLAFWLTSGSSANDMDKYRLTIIAIQFVKSQTEEAACC